MNQNRGAVVHAANDLRVDDLPEPAAAAGQVVLDIAFGGVCGSDLREAWTSCRVSPSPSRWRSGCMP